MNNQSIQIIRGGLNYDPSTSEEILLDGQPFYSKYNKRLYIGSKDDGYTYMFSVHEPYVWGEGVTTNTGLAVGGNIYIDNYITTNEYRAEDKSVENNYIKFTNGDNQYNLKMNSAYLQDLTVNWTVVCNNNVNTKRIVAANLPIKFPFMLI